MPLQKLLIYSCLLLCQPLCAQDIAAEAKALQSAVKQNPISISGNVSASSLAYNATGIAARRDPFYYVLAANLNISLLNKINIPFSAVVTQVNTSYSNGLERYAQPFSQFGCSPSYKGITLHAGYRNLNYSEYSLNGLLFLGAGLELKPKKSIFSGMASYGRFVHNMPVSNEQTASSYERFGGAFKIRAAKDDNFFECVLMQLKDRPAQNLSAGTLLESPKENLVTDFTAAVALSKKVKLSAEYAYSMYSADIRQEGQAIEGYTYVNQLFTNRSSSKYSAAGSAALDYNRSKFGAGVKFKRIAPDYSSLGSPFITNDVEEISGSIRTALIKSKLQLQGSVGLQQNNLDNTQLLRNKRIIASVNSNFTLSEKISAQAFYSNFSSNSRLVRDPYSDSLRVAQVNESANTQLNYSIKSNQSTLQFSGTYNYQNSKINTQNTRFISQQFSMQQAYPKQGFNYSLQLMHGNNTIENTSSIEQLSAGLQMQKTWKNGKYRVAISSSMQQQLTSKKAISNCFSESLDLNYTISKTTSLGLQAQLLHRKGLNQSVKSFSEQRMNLIFKQSFQVKKKG